MISCAEAFVTSYLLVSVIYLGPAWAFLAHLFIRGDSLPSTALHVCPPSLVRHLLSTSDEQPKEDSSPDARIGSTLHNPASQNAIRHCSPLRRPL